MNTRFKFFLINSLSRYRFSRDSGFALPMAIMVGACIIIVGLAVVIQAQSNQSKVVSQKAKATSMAAAETGLTRVQNMFAGARFAALYDDTELASAIASDNSGSPNTSNALGNTLNTQLVAVANSNSSACGTSDSATKTTAMKVQLAQLQNLAAATANPATYQTIDSKNSYRLVSYKYAGTSGALPGSGVTATGRMVIEGKSTEGGGESVSRIMVDIPISGAATAALPSGTLAPGLWIKYGGVDDGTYETASTNTPDNSSTYNAGIVFSDCDNVLNTSYVSSMNTRQIARGYSASESSVAMPSIPPIPTGVTPYSISSGGNGQSYTSLPASGQVAASDGYYYYQTPANTDLSGNWQFDTTGGKKFRVYLNGDIPKTTSIKNTCTSSSNCNPTDLQIFGQKSSGGIICMNGNDDRQVSAYVLAPNYDLGKTGKGNFVGSYIVKSWGKISGGGNGCGSNNGKLAVIQTQAWGNVPPELRPGSTPLPTIAAFSGWQQMDITASIPAPPSPVTVASGGGTVSTTNGAMCTVPTLEEKSTAGFTAATLLDYVKSALTTAQLTGTPTGTEKNTGATDTILSQSPAAGSSVDCGTAVSYEYKLPTQMCTVPAMTGSDITKSGSNYVLTSAGTLKLTNNNLTLGSFSSSNVPGSTITVTGQTPLASSQTTCGGSVNITFTY